MPSHATDDEIDPELVHLHNIIVLLAALVINVWWLSLITALSAIFFVWLLRE